ncbi:MAG: hypothetical protein ACRD2L_17125, partial [Terriglobia bacterium]
DDMAIWRESAPAFLPWKPMIEEIKALDKDQRLRLEIIGPGNWMVHSLVPPPAAAKPAVKAAGKAKSEKPAAKRSRTAAKRK